MKKVTLMALLLIALTHTNSVFARLPGAPDEKIRITATSMAQKKVSIRIINLSEKQNAILKIKDEKGRQLHAETIHHRPVFIRAYDFSKIPGEKYTVEVRTKEGITTQTIDVKDASVEISFKPLVITEPGAIKVMFTNPLPTPVFLSLYDDSGKTVYNAKIPSQEGFASRLNVSRLPYQPYSLRLESGKYEYIETIKMQ